MPTKILIIEDADALRNDIMEMLRYEGYDVYGAADGVDGVQAARDCHPDLIICDIMMPRMDGFEVLETLKQDGAGITVPFIFLTAKTDKLDIRAGMDSGANDYLTKPFAGHELISSIQQRIKMVDGINKITNEKLDELRENIILALPHELRTPLTGILGFSDMLIQDAADMEPDKVAEMAQYIYSAAQRLYRLTENYVIYSQLQILRLDRQRVEIMRSFKTSEPGDLIEDVVLLKSQQYHREMDVQVDVDNHASISILDDNFRKIVEELVDNALKFSAAGTPVEISGKFEADHYTLTIVDRGRGMRRDEIQRIGAFVQFGRKLHEQQGSGFGLAIVQRAVDLHDGDFAIDSMPGDYTRVRVTLPAVPALEPSQA